MIFGVHERGSYPARNGHACSSEQEGRCEETRPGHADYLLETGHDRKTRNGLFCRNRPLRRHKNPLVSRRVKRPPARRFARFARLPWLPCLLVFAPLVLVPRMASAQVRWDASAQVGVTNRFLFNRPQGGPDAGFGPAFQVNGHVALLPLLRVGAYVSGDTTSAGPASRQMLGGGARIVGLPPLGSRRFRVWVFAGFGYELVFAPSYHTTLTLSPDESTTPKPTDALVTQAGGSMYEVPFGVGMAYALRPPFELVAELGGRVGFGYSGSVYQDPGRAFFAAGYPENRLLPAGNDAFSTFFTVGLGFGH